MLLYGGREEACSHLPVYHLHQADDPPILVVIGIKQQQAQVSVRSAGRWDLPGGEAQFSRLDIRCMADCERRIVEKKTMGKTLCIHEIRY
eukprot:scaffold83893_cov31-Prasinocladus_malaysianus.AAC.2